MNSGVKNMYKRNDCKDLTPKQFAVYELALQGYTDQEIRDKLSMKQTALKSMLSRIREKVEIDRSIRHKITHNVKK